MILAPVDHPRKRLGGRAVLALLLCAVMALLSGCIASKVLSRTWIEVQSEHFTITSDMHVEDAERLARTLELFRAAVLVITTTRSVDSRIPTRVFFFRDEASFRIFQPMGGIAGYFLPDLRENFVSVVDTKLMDTENVMRHEYVHFLVRNGSRRLYPRWYDEGFAELLSTATPMGPYVVVGVVPDERIRTLASGITWIPLRSLLAYDGGLRSHRWLEMFYAESWLFLHYLSRDLEHAAALAPTVQTYLDRIEAGADVDTATQAAFGMGPDELDEKLRTYLEDGSFTPIGVRKDRLHWSEETHARILDPAEAAQRLGELSLASGRPSHAESLFRAALEADPQLARAHADLGSVLVQEEKWSEAGQELATALELGPNDPLNEVDYGEYWLGRAGRPEDARQKQELLGRARAHLQRAIDLDQWKPEPWAEYGATFLVPGEDPKEAVSRLEQALDLLPSNTGAQLMLAEAYCAVDRKPVAEALLHRILAWSPPDGQTAEKAQALLHQIEPAQGASD